MCKNVVLLASFCLLLINCILAEEMYGAEVGNMVLSRKKRYLIFPDGTSLQLVYCFTIPVVDYQYIWTYGFTVSAAWLLPTHPEDIMQHKRKKTEERIDKPSTTLVQYIDSVNRVANKNKYSSPNFAQTYMPFYSHKDYYDEWRRPHYQQNDRRIYTYNRNRDEMYKPVNRKPTVYKQHEYHKHPLYTKLHRISRRDLYHKLEQLLTATEMKVGVIVRRQKKDGRACLLKAICQVNKSTDDSNRGSFLDEILKTMFRNKFSEDKEDGDEYDSAANKEDDCEELYPTCTDNILS